MSKLPFIKIMCVIALALVSSIVLARIIKTNSGQTITGLPENREAVYAMAIHVPAGTYPTGSREPGCNPPEQATLNAFFILPTEVPAAWVAAFKNENCTDKNGALPAAKVSHYDAVAFCQWFSKRYDIHARLPSRREWETAARAGKGGITYSWGWNRQKDQEFEGQSPHSVTAGRSNPWGLYNMSGNIAEWGNADDNDTHAPVFGGSWAERDLKYLRISHRQMFSKDYRDADVGFRIVIDPPAGE